MPLCSCGKKKKRPQIDIAGDCSISTVMQNNISYVFSLQIDVVEGGICVYAWLYYAKLCILQLFNVNIQKKIADFRSARSALYPPRPIWLLLIIHQINVFRAVLITS